MQIADMTTAGIRIADTPTDRSLTADTESAAAGKGSAAAVAVAVGTELAAADNRFPC